jgi:hypothetical protein
METLESFATRQQAQQEAMRAAPQQPQGTPQQPQAQPTGTEQQPQQQGGQNIIQQAFDVLAAPGQGVNDWFVDTLNLIPGVDLKKRTKFENNVTQSIRDVSSVVLPTIFVSKGLGGSLKTAASASKVKFFDDKFVQFLAPRLLELGVGAGVDYAVETNQQDDNLFGIAKRAVPSWFGWIPDDIATLDSDSPEVKRNKNVLGGVGTSLAIEMFEVVGRIAKAARGITRATQWVPESEKAKNWFGKNLTSDAVDDAEEALAEIVAKRSDALDELGEYNFSKNANLDEPMLGVHDMYGYEEVGTRVVDDLGIVSATVDYARIANNADTAYGRVGSVVSESALKYGLEVSGGTEIIARGLAEQLVSTYHLKKFLVQAKSLL